MSTQRLVDMANQIAANVPDRANAAQQTALHLRTFWAPSMRDSLAAYATDHPEVLSPEAREAVAMLGLTA